MTTSSSTTLPQHHDRDPPTTRLRVILLHRWWNTLHGFDAWAREQPELLIGIVHNQGPRDFSNRKSRIAMKAGVSERLFYLTQDHLVLKNHSNRNLIPSLINGVRQAGFAITLSTKLEPCYMPDGPMFSLEASERLAVPRLRHWLQNGMFQYLQRFWHHGDDRLWITAEGKAMASVLRSVRPQWHSSFWDEPLQLGGVIRCKWWYMPQLDYPPPATVAAQTGHPELDADYDADGIDEDPFDTQPIEQDTRLRKRKEPDVPRYMIFTLRPAKRVKPDPDPDYVPNVVERSNK
jgi:hypothetical protein